jgi:hypothetical protein
LSVTIILLCFALAAVASDGTQKIDGSASGIVGVQKASTVKRSPGMGLRLPVRRGLTNMKMQAPLF